MMRGYSVLIHIAFCMSPQLISDLPGSLRKLLSKCSDGFWCNGRILVQVERQSVFIIDGQLLLNLDLNPVVHMLQTVAKGHDLLTSFRVLCWKLMRVGGV